MHPLRVVASVSALRWGPRPGHADLLLQLRAGSCRDRYGDDVGYVELIGELDASSARQIRRPLVGIARSTADLVIDATQVSFIDSAGLRLLEIVCDRASTDGNSVRLHDQSRAVTRLIRLVGADQMIATCTPDHTGNDRDFFASWHQSWASRSPEPVGIGSVRPDLIPARIA